jgi:hypothetical protein
MGETEIGGHGMVSDVMDFMDFDCTIFVDGASSKAELFGWLAEAIVGQASERRVVAPGVGILARHNDEDNVRDKSDPHDGFLFFSHIVEVHFDSSITRDRRVREVSKMLEYLWSHNVPAVAACDYEDELPRAGGMGTSFVWPISG